MKPYTISQFNEHFPNDSACLEYMFTTRYGKDYECPDCYRKGFYKVKGRKCYACAWCGHQVHPLAKSIIHKSATPLRDWFYIIYVMDITKNRVFAKEIQRYLGVTYKTAWRIKHKIKEYQRSS